MTYDIQAALKDPVKATLFAEYFAEGYLTPAFGARSKSEIDLLVFTALINAGVIDPAGPVYKLARTFNITPTRVRTLIFNWQLREPGLRSDLSPALRAALQRTRFSKDGTLLTFGIESPLLKEEVIARLKAQGVFADASFAREIVRMPVEAFVEFLDELIDPATKKAFIDRLTRDKQLKDTSFKSIAVGVFGRLGEKIAGEVGKEIAADIVDATMPVAKDFGCFLLGLLESNGEEAAKAARKVLGLGSAP
ncbi:hypothetical protein [Paracoccus sp. R86501]|uniref:hypothetical protein n=1 Tax=Paracoccus sp. R86501 TaxID=3101711 RepID=UPI0036724045